MIISDLAENTTPCKITLLTAPDVVGKQFSLQADGTVTKQSNIAVPVWKAATVNILSLASLQFLLSTLTANQAIILDYVEGVAGEYWLISKSMVDAEWKSPDGAPVYQLKKSSFTPSGIVALDWDHDESRPGALQDADYESWWERMVGVEPSLQGVGRLIVPSSSSRVIHTDGRDVFTSPSYHTYCMVTGKERVESVGQLLDARFWLAGQGYMATSKGGGQLRRTPFDPCTFSISRRVFESAPSVGPGLRLNGWDLNVQDGGLWDLNRIEMLTDEERQRYKEMTQREVRLVDNGRISVEVEVSDLDDALIVETKDFGWMSIADYKASSHEKLRCNTPFRDSDSWAAYLNHHEDGSVFLYDVGDGTKHMQPKSISGFNVTGENYDFIGTIPDPAVVTTSPQQTTDSVVDIPIENAVVEEISIKKSYQQVIADVLLLGPTDFDGMKSIIKDTVWLDLLEQDAVVDALKASPRGFKVNTSRALLKTYTGELRPRELMADGLVFPIVTENDTPRDHVTNMEAILNHNGVVVHYNVMKHEPEIFVENKRWLEGEEANLQLYYFRDLCTEQGMPYARVGDHMGTIAANNSYHPVKEWLATVKWDGVSRLRKLLDTIVVDGDENDEKQRDMLVTKWMLSAMACLKGYRVGSMFVPPRGVLCFSGKQYAGKTSWLRYLAGPVPDAFVEGISLDTSNKDVVKKVISHWICELGEIDSTFSRSSISRLKAFLSQPSDELRMPYAPKTSKWPRRTVFAGTVNDEAFLRDATGNTRFWPIAVSRFDLDAIGGFVLNGEMLQIWKEIESMYDEFVLNAKETGFTGNGLAELPGSWWLSTDQLYSLISHTERFRDVPWSEEVILERYDWDSDKSNWHKRTISQIAKECGLSHNGNLRPADLASMRGALCHLTGQTGPLSTQVNNIRGRYWTIPPLNISAV